MDYLRLEVMALRFAETALLFSALNRLFSPSGRGVTIASSRSRTGLKAGRFSTISLFVANQNLLFYIFEPTAMYLTTMELRSVVLETSAIAVVVSRAVTVHWKARIFELVWS